MGVTRRVIVSMRIRHWIKNLLLFFPLLFAGALGDLHLVHITLLGFLAFCLVTSGVYILNDIWDREADRLHPTKRNRPIASGALNVRTAYSVASALVTIGVVIAGFLDLTFLILLGIYFVLNWLYNLFLKRVAVVDITIIALGFVLRIFAGGVLGDVEISHWLVLITFLLALFLALGKRRNEISEDAVVVGYNARFIDVALTLFGSVTVVAYILYTISPEVTARIGSEFVYFTCLPVVLGLLRYLQLLIVFDRPADPTDVVLRDPFLLILVLVWLGGFIFLIYA